MMKIYTENQLIRYIYNELDAEASAQIEQEIHQNPATGAKLNELKQCISSLDEVGVDPSETSVQMILEHAQKLKTSSQLLGV